MAATIANIARSPTAFISGHTDLSQADFDTIYIPLIDAALSDGHNLVLGDAVGVDTQALVKAYPDIEARITVYASRPDNVAMLEALAVKVFGPGDPSLLATKSVEAIIGAVKGGRDKARFKHLVRDTNMTLHSDYDILYVRSEGESRDLYGDKYWKRASATQLNRERRGKMELMRVAEDIEKDGRSE
ncbi:hypothetical protein LTR22_024476 [Elasticomyces elasticus]|nr:hypothetical protein LTR22_024476 [Elasticomyces elasticus]